MDRKQPSTKKRVTIAQLKPGMYVTALDRSWFRTPFIFHRRLIKSAEHIEVLRKQGIHAVWIDTARGADVEAPPATITEGGGESAPAPPTTSAPRC